VHFHVQSAEAEAKVWLRPEAVIADSVGLSRRGLAKFAHGVEMLCDGIAGAWHEHVEEIRAL
jgi:hypothetical protein